eukprot:1331199-Rhodomonas_salina.1
MVLRIWCHAYGATRVLCAAQYRGAVWAYANGGRARAYGVACGSERAEGQLERGAEPASRARAAG